MREALVNARVLLDDGFTDGRAVLIEDGRIAGIARDDATTLRGAVVRDLGGGLLLPGFVDVQVNGGGGVLFNDDPSPAAIARIARAHRAFGTTALLPTLISDDLGVVDRAMRAVESAIDARTPGVLGIHIEGPYLNAERKGIHDAGKLRALDHDALALLTSLRAGRTLVTLAPEVTTPDVIERLVRAGVIVSIGHTNATYADTKAALAAGARGFTHLFNAMSQLSAREPGVVGAALDDPTSWYGLIVDGHHVSPAAMRLALRAKTPARCMLVTDAMPTVGTSLRSFVLQGRTIHVRDRLCVDADGRLAGTNFDMADAVRSATELLDVDLATAVRMASAHPAAFLDLERERGRIAVGLRADLVLADESLHVRATWIGGERAEAGG